MTARLKNRFIFLSCLFFSLAMHVVCICILYSFTFHKQQNLSALFWLSSSNPHLLQIDEQNRESTLQEVFEQIWVAPSNYQTPYDLLNSNRSLKVAPHLESVDSLALVKKSSLSFSIEEESSLISVCLPKLESEPTLTPSVAPMDSFVNKKPEIDPVMQTTLAPQLPQVSETFNDKQQLSLPKENMSATIYKEDLQIPLTAPTVDLSIQNISSIIDPNQMDQIANQIENPPPLFSEIGNLEVMRHFLPEISPVSRLKGYSFPSFAIANDWNHLFETHISYTPQDKGYVFSIELFPKLDQWSYWYYQQYTGVADP